MTLRRGSVFLPSTVMHNPRMIATTTTDMISLLDENAEKILDGTALTTVTSGLYPSIVTASVTISLGSCTSNHPIVFTKYAAAPARAAATT